MGQMGQIVQVVQVVQMGQMVQMGQVGQVGQVRISYDVKSKNQFSLFTNHYSLITFYLV